MSTKTQKLNAEKNSTSLQTGKGTKRVLRISSYIDDEAILFE